VASLASQTLSTRGRVWGQD